MDFIIRQIIDDRDRIDQIGQLSSEVIVQKLWQGDEDAWGYIYLNSILPVVRGKFFFQILVDRKLTHFDVYAMVFEMMLAQKKLANYRFICPIKFWMRYYVTRAIIDYCKKNGIPVSERKETVVQYDKEAQPAIIKDDLAMAQHCFAQMWKNNPMRAYVHLLKTKHDWSAKQIKDLLHISSENNVAKIAERAMSDMRELRLQLSGEKVK